MSFATSSYLVEVGTGNGRRGDFAQVKVREEHQASDSDLNVLEQVFEEIQQQPAAEQVESMLNVRQSVPTSVTMHYSKVGTSNYQEGYLRQAEEPTGKKQNSRIAIRR